jgi:hypothetical protein
MAGRHFTVIKRTPYYKTGPQPGSPEDGYFEVGSKVSETPGHGGGATGYVHVKSDKGPGEGWVIEADLKKS